MKITIKKYLLLGAVLWNAGMYGATSNRTLGATDLINLLTIQTTQPLSTKTIQVSFAPKLLSNFFNGTPTDYTSRNDIVDIWKIIHDINFGGKNLINDDEKNAAKSFQNNAKQIIFAVQQFKNNLETLEKRNPAQNNIGHRNIYALGSDALNSFLKEFPVSLLNKTAPSLQVNEDRLSFPQLIQYDIVTMLTYMLACSVNSTDVVNEKNLLETNVDINSNKNTWGDDARKGRVSLDLRNNMEAYSKEATLLLEKLLRAYSIMESAKLQGLKNKLNRQSNDTSPESSRSLLLSQLDELSNGSLDENYIKILLEAIPKHLKKCLTIVFIKLSEEKNSNQDHINYFNESIKLLNALTDNLTQSLNDYQARNKAINQLSTFTTAIFGDKDNNTDGLLGKADKQFVIENSLWENAKKALTPDSIKKQENAGTLAVITALGKDAYQGAENAATKVTNVLEKAFEKGMESSLKFEQIEAARAAIQAENMNKMIDIEMEETVLEGKEAELENEEAEILNQGSFGSPAQNRLKKRQIEQKRNALATHKRLIELKKRRLAAENQQKEIQLIRESGGGLAYTNNLAITNLFNSALQRATQAIAPQPVQKIKRKKKKARPTPRPVVYEEEEEIEEDIE